MANDEKKEKMSQEMMSARTLRIGVAQFAGSLDPAKNRRKVLEYVNRLADEGAQLICFQEIATTTYFCCETDQKYFEWAEPVPGPTSTAVAEAARERGVAVVLPLFERADPNFHNTALFIGPTGEILGRYRKMHVPLDVGALDDIVGYERHFFTPGDSLPVVGMADAKVGCVICYDRHYPELVRSLALDGAEVLVVPTATPRASHPFWRAELIAHAVQNSLVVVGINRAGVDEGGDGSLDFFGDSVVVMPSGEVVLELGPDEAHGVAEVDLGALEEWRVAFGLMRERRPDRYARLLELR